MVIYAKLLGCFAIENLLTSRQDVCQKLLILFYIFQDAEGVLVANIGSYMGGVDLWQNEDESYDNLDPQSMYDKLLEVVSISGTWHLGKLQVKYLRKLGACVFPSFIWL